MALFSEASMLELTADRRKCSTPLSRISRGVISHHWEGFILEVNSYSFDKGLRAYIAPVLPKLTVGVFCDYNIFQRNRESIKISEGIQLASSR